MTDQFEGWKKLLALKAKVGTKLGFRQAIQEAGLAALINLDDPLSGFFRIRAGKDGPFVPVKILRGDFGDLTVLRSGEQVPVDKVWPHCVWEPITEDTYIAVTVRGEEWPDIHVIVAAIPSAGHNQPPLDEVDEIKIEIENASAGVKDYAKIESDDVRDRAQSLRSRLLELSSKADKRRDALVRPHLEGQRDINAVWQPLVKGAKAAADAIKTAQVAWATVKLKRRQAEEARREAEANAAAAVAAGQPAPPPPAPPVEPERVSPIATFRGGYGRASSEKPVEVITEVTNWAALFDYFSGESDVRELLLKKARKVLKDTGEVPPGTKTETQAKVA